MLRYCSSTSRSPSTSSLQPGHWSIHGYCGSEVTIQRSKGPGAGAGGSGLIVTFTPSRPTTGSLIAMGPDPPTGTCPTATLAPPAMTTPAFAAPPAEPAAPRETPPTSGTACKVIALISADSSSGAPWTTNGISLSAACSSILPTATAVSALTASSSAALGFSSLRTAALRKGFAISLCAMASVAWAAVLDPAVAAVSAAALVSRVAFDARVSPRESPPPPHATSAAATRACMPTDQAQLRDRDFDIDFISPVPLISTGEIMWAEKCIPRQLFLRDCIGYSINQGDAADWRCSLIRIFAVPRDLPQTETQGPHSPLLSAAALSFAREGKV